MEKCLYKLVDSNILQPNDKQNDSWKPLLRQVVISSGIWNSYFMAGLCQGSATVIIPQLRREANSTEAVSDEMASWMSSVEGYAALPWLIIITILAKKFGRKYPYLLVSIITLISYIIMCFSVTAIQILITSIMRGPLFACQITISIVIITEYSSPKNRGLFLTLKSASMNWGIWVANALGTFLPWRAIAIAGIICSSYNVVSTIFWCESPSWLASKHRYKECAKAHRWVKGAAEDSEKELEALIKTCETYQEIDDAETKIKSNLWINFCKTLVEPRFYKPIILCVGILSLYNTNGKTVCTVYAIDIIKKITSSESTAYMGMLLLDGVTVTGMYIGCVLAKLLKRRTLLFAGGIAGIFFLFVLALYLFLSKLDIINVNRYISLGLLMLYFLFISVGPKILCTSIYGELLPLKYRTEGMLITGCYGMFLMSTTLKTGPQIFKSFGLHGAFLFYASVASVFTFLLYKYLPETKDKTMEEIETHFVGKRLEEHCAESQSMHKI